MTSNIISEYPSYIIYADGRVYNLKKRVFCKQHRAGSGKKYLYVNVKNVNNRRCTIGIHVLIAKAFLEAPENPEHTIVCHKDETLSNGVLNNEPENLFWGNQSINILDAFNKGRKVVSEVSKKLLSKPVLQIKDDEIICRYSSGSEAARKIGGHQANISACCRGLMKTAYGFKWRYA